MTTRSRTLLGRFALVACLACGACGIDASALGDAAPRDAADAGTGASDAGPQDAGDAATGADTEIAWRKCPASDTFGFAGECATVSLRLDASNAASPLIDIIVRKVLARSESPKSQIWLLAGGPGDPGTVLTDHVFRLRELDRDLEILVPSFRGSEGDTRFDCEGLLGALGWIEPDDATTAANCGRMLQSEWGEDMRLFSTTADAHDVSELARLARVDDVPVFAYGVGYGSVRAQRLLQVEPALWAGVVLDSVMDSALSWAQERIDVDDAAQRVFAECDADAACTAKIGPDSWKRMTAFMDGAADCPTSLELDRAAYQRSFATLLSSRFTAAAVPALLYRAERCDAEDATAIETAIERSGALDDATRTTAALGLHLQIVSSELRGVSEPGINALEDAMNASVLSSREAAGYRAVRDEWPMFPADPLDDAFPDTKVPMLLLAGELDPLNTQELAEATKSHYVAAHQTLVVLPHAGQELIVGNAGACARSLVGQFLSDPTAAIDRACTEQANPLAFSDFRVIGLFGTKDAWEN